MFGNKIQGDSKPSVAKLQSMHLEELNGLGFTIFKNAANLHMAEINEIFSMILPNVGSVYLQERASIFGNKKLNNLFSLLKNDRVFSNVLEKLNCEIPVQCEANILVGESYWHRDGADIPFESYRAAIYLDVLDNESATLCCVPGSHRATEYWSKTALEYLSNLECLEQVGVSPLVSIKSSPGDIILFNCNLIHGSKATDKRRQVAYTFTSKEGTRDEAGSRANFLLNRFVNSTVLFK